MGLKFDALKCVKDDRESYRFRVRVVRKWFVPGFINHEQPMSMELILMDEYGDRIQATVRKSVMHKFSDIIKEGHVYRMSYFGVVPNTGSYRATSHEFKLMFQLPTTVSETECVSIPFFGVAVVPFDVISQMDSDSDYLVDLDPLLCSISIL